MSQPYLKSTKGLQDLALPHSPNLISQHSQTFFTPNTHPMPYHQWSTSNRLSLLHIFLMCFPFHSIWFLPLLYQYPTDS